VTMKQVGLNVASDPLMSLEYIGVKAGMVIMVADDPGPISSQTEQDTRRFAEFSKLPCFDPSSVEEAYQMIQDAFEFSETYGTPVFFRPTTRVCHGYASISVKDPEEYTVHQPEGFVKDSSRWVIFPRLSFQNHQKIVARNEALSRVFSDYAGNRIHAEAAPTRRGIAAQGISYAYAMDALPETPVRVWKVSTPYPFPEQQALRFLKDLDEVLCLEELDPVIEDALTAVCGKYGLHVKIRGKHTGDVPAAGENTADSVASVIRSFLELPAKSAEFGSAEKGADIAQPPLPVRPPVLCAGCPHRASFFAVKTAMRGKKTVFCGDIGCYTLGNAQPLDMVDTCLCMGAGVNIAQGIGKIEPDTKCFAFVGDSTFFASAITGVVNAVYNQADMTLVVLDNSTTAMTGHQPHPGTGKTMMGNVVDKVDMVALLQALGLTAVEVVDPFDQEKSIQTVQKLADQPGVKAIVFRSPCAVLIPGKTAAEIDRSRCIGCRKCIRSLGCPGIVLREGKVVIDSALCTGCGLCATVCPVQAIGGKQA